MRSEDRCKAHYHGARCRLRVGHLEEKHTTASSCEVGIQWKGNDTPELWPKPGHKKIHIPAETPARVLFILACKQYNSEHSRIVPKKSTRSIIEARIRAGKTVVCSPDPLWAERVKAILDGNIQESEAPNVQEPGV